MGRRQRGRLTLLSERKFIADAIQEAIEHGSRKKPACREADIDFKTYNRWHLAGQTQSDKRPVYERPTPKNKLSKAEIQQIITVSNEEDYANLPPSQIVPKLADKGTYIASESSFYRVMKKYN